MATSNFCSLLLFLFLFSSANFISITSSDNADTYVLSTQPVYRPTGEKQSHLRLYWHDTVSGPNPTSVRVAEAPITNNSSTHFGAVYIMDDPLTTGPSMYTKLVGRAQGLYSFAGLAKEELLMAMNFVFTDGEYNGSTLAILGHNEVFSRVREMPVVGGSGLFRFARGYVQLQTYLVNNTNAVVEYNVFVNHY